MTYDIAVKTAAQAGIRREADHSHLLDITLNHQRRHLTGLGIGRKAFKNTIQLIHVRHGKLNALLSLAQFHARHHLHGRCGLASVADRLDTGLYLLE